MCHLICLFKKYIQTLTEFLQKSVLNKLAGKKKKRIISSDGVMINPTTWVSQVSFPQEIASAALNYVWILQTDESLTKGFICITDKSVTMLPFPLNTLSSSSTFRKWDVSLWRLQHDFFKCQVRHCYCCSGAQSCQILQPHGLQHTRLPCPSLSPRVCSNSCPLSQWCYLAISSSVVPFSSCLQSLPASESFPMSQLFAWGGQSTGVSASASFLPKKS